MAHGSERGHAGKYHRHFVSAVVFYLWSGEVEFVCVLVHDEIFRSGLCVVNLEISRYMGYTALLNTLEGLPTKVRE